MQKSEERVELEKKITDAHECCFDIATDETTIKDIVTDKDIVTEIVRDEFGGNDEAASSSNLLQESFFRKMHERTRKLQQVYINGYRQLEDLERREGYPAMLAYAALLDSIAEHLPRQNRVFGYYPFSGVDFYWARIFEKLVVCEDIGFDEKEQIPEMWWGVETYGAKKRQEIISILKSQGIIPVSSNVEILSGDAGVDRYDNRFNNQQSTLLVKGGHNVLGYIETRFQGRHLEYGAIITASSFNPLRDMEHRFAKDGYRRHASFEGGEFLAPYAMELNDIHIFLKNPV